MKKSTSRVRVAGALAIATSLILAGCSSSVPDNQPDGTAAPFGSLEELVAAAQAEGTFTYYTSQSPGIVELLVPAFEAEYGITVDMLRLNSGELQQRLIAEGTSSSASIAELPPEFFVASADLFIDLTEAEVPALGDIAEHLVSKNSVTTSALPWVIGYNTDLVKDVPTTWEEVVTDWSGEYLFTDPESSNGYMAFTNEVWRAFGDDLVRDMAANAGQLSNSGASAAQQIAAGEFALTIPNYPGQLTPLMAQGANVDYFLPQEPTFALPMTAGILKNAPSPASARLFLNWLISHDGQSALCDTGLAGSILSDDAGLEGCVELPEGWAPYELDVDAERRSMLLDLLGR